MAMENNRLGTGGSSRKQKLGVISEHSPNQSGVPQNACSVGFQNCCHSGTAIYRVSPQNISIHTDSSVLKMQCILIKAAFRITQSV